MGERLMRDEVVAECRGGPRDGERWTAYCHGEPMFPDSRLAGYVFVRERLILRWDPDSPQAMNRGTP